MSITASATSAPGTIWWVRLGETPGRSASVGGDRCRSARGSTSGRSASPSTRSTSGPSSDGAAPQMRASERNVLDVAAATSGGPPRRRCPASWAMSARIFLRSARICRSPGVAVAEVLAGQPGRAERDRPGDVGLLVGAAGDLERAAADVEDRQPAGRPAEPASYGEEGQPRLVLARQDGDARHRSRRRRGRARRRSCRRRGPPRWRSRACPARPCPRRRRRASATNAGQRLDADLVTSPSRRGARRGAAAPCGSTPAAGPRRGGRRPPAGDRCWSRCRGRRGACARIYRAASPVGWRRCPKSTWSSPAPSSSSPTPATPTRCSAAT